MNLSTLKDMEIRLINLHCVCCGQLMIMIMFCLSKDELLRQWAKNKGKPVR